MHGAERVEVSLARQAAEDRPALAHLRQAEIEARADRRRRIFAIDDALQEVEAGIFRDLLERNGANAKRREISGKQFHCGHAALPPRTDGAAVIVRRRVPRKPARASGASMPRGSETWREIGRAAGGAGGSSRRCTRSQTRA